MEGLFYLGMGLFGLRAIGIVLNRREFITCTCVNELIELVFLSILLIWVSVSGGIDDFSGQILIFMVLLIAAAESALGLVFLVIYFRIRDTIGVNSLSLL